MLSNKVSSKSSLYSYFKEQLVSYLHCNIPFILLSILLFGYLQQMYMPPENMFTKDHLKSILSGHKKLLKLKDVNFVQVPMYDDCSVKHHYSKMIKRENLSYYFPNSFPKNRQCVREYF